MNNTAATVDWFSAQQRAEEKLRKAMRRRDDADFAVRQAEVELEAIKRKRREAAGPGAR